MTDPLAPVGDGQTEVPEDLRHHLIPTYIATLGELHEAEEENIAEATLGREPSAAELLDDLYLRSLHKAMFAKVWKWAGTYRPHDTDIGIGWQDIPVAIRDLVANTKTWIESTTLAADELALRFHHRLVLIHPFVNGNGRHARFAAEYLVEALGQPRFTWGHALGVERDELRQRYRQALQRMDSDPDDIEELLAFARS
jgi:Fic-DOC domain mobile mystery protein B